MTSGTSRTNPRHSGGRVAAGFLTAGLSAAGAGVLLYGLLHDWWLIALVMFIAAMGLVGIATVVGTLWSGEAIGPLLGAPPLLIIFWMALDLSSDPLEGLFGVIVTFIVLCVSAASWGSTFLPRRRRRRGLAQPGAGSPS